MVWTHNMSEYWFKSHHWHEETKNGKSATTFNRMTFSITTLSKMTFSITINKSRQSAQWHSIQCSYAQCHICWESQIIPLCRMLLCWVPLCWMSWRIKKLLDSKTWQQSIFKCLSCLLILSLQKQYLYKNSKLDHLISIPVSWANSDSSAVTKWLLI
jgi:hypothetical protein